LGETITRILHVRAELLVAGALLLGWLLITQGIAQLTAPVAWTFSIGLLLLLLCGWRLLWRLFSDGLYDLTRERPRNG
jgi:cytochrome b561